MINFGIIGAGNIANRFADSLSHFKDANLYAVACRGIEKAAAFQRKHPCQLIYDDYDELLSNKDIDIVYIAVPHGFHYLWISKALKKGKAVLCEKPATLNAEQMKSVQKLAEAKNIFFMEAMKSRFTPAYQEIKTIINNGEIGKIISIDSSFCREISKKTATYHFQPIQGGCLLDIGIYNVALTEDFAKTLPKVEVLENKMDISGVETYTKAKLLFPNLSATIECAFDRNKQTEATIKGEKGQIEIKNFHRAESFIVKTSSGTKNYHIAYEQDDFHGEIAHVIQCYEKNKIESSIMPIRDSVNCALIIEKIKNQIPELAV
ncbi:Gfo/Idh/MocA family oxidoreductase [Oenococcus sp. UCMA 16435]|nr:Gfo/Idh/MocA family oxidoreductase [Oenococcus sp. UCMA 16435]MDI4585323.1 gfo/Idh/MocA family oxidoreductase [Oenococcus sp. UCMA 14587]